MRSTNLAKTAQNDWHDVGDLKLQCLAIAIFSSYFVVVSNEHQWTLFHF